MNYDQTMTWLDGRLKQEARLSALLGVLALGGGAVFLVITWFVMFAVCVFCLQPFLRMGPWVYSVIPTALLAILFWGHATTSQEYLTEYSVTTGTATDKVVVFYLPYVGMVSNVNPLAPDTMHTMVKFITDMLYCGPRTVRSALRLFAKALRLRRVDVPSCAAVLTVLAEAGHRMSFQAIVSAVEGLDPTTTFPQLPLIDGVLFLESNPPGLALSSELKEVLNQ